MFAQCKWAKYAEIQKLQPPSCFRYLLVNFRPQTRGLSPTFNCHLQFPNKLV
uniref:Uncharacterized protein n=1 Tax=Colobus angolensis palliatus TaxID=336983 RepID=A0A2K5I910_COLAP